MLIKRTRSVILRNAFVWGACAQSIDNISLKFNVANNLYQLKKNNERMTSVKYGDWDNRFNKFYINIAFSEPHVFEGSCIFNNK